MFQAALAVASAVSAYMEADQRYLASLTPEKRREVLAERAWRRHLETLESAPEVKLARQYIATDNLQGVHAERLLNFARELVARRDPCEADLRGASTPGSIPTIPL